MWKKYNSGRSLGWRRLDNAAKIFPSTSTDRNTRVFRFSAELYEDINPETLQQATEYALDKFPYYRCVLKKGVFWYYLEESDLNPVVVEENKMPCSAMYDKDRLKLLFEVSYYKKKINLEIFHVLSDGTGAMQFLKTIIAKYLYLKYPNDFKGNISELDYSASQNEKMADSFKKYYKKNKKSKVEKGEKAFHINGAKREAGQLQVIEGLASCKELIEVSRKYNTTITVFLTAVFIKAISDEMTVREEIKPVVLMIPVNLRKFFPSETARNFFGMIKTEYNFSKRDGSFEDILKAVDEAFKRELIKEKLSIRMNELAALEYNPFVKIAPLALKNIVLSMARNFGESKETAVLSNVGIIKMPDEFSSYIDKFSVVTSTLKLQLCICSYKDNLALGFSSYFESTDIQMRFFRFLSSLGINIQIRSNDSYPQQNDE